jgi:predicted transposase YbfD/YdcC
MLKKTLDLILSVGCHFLVQVKGNCRKLWGIIALHTALRNPISTYEYYEQENGRQIYRRVELYDNQAELHKGWNGIERFIKVRRWGIRNHKPFHEVSFYILSKPINSAQIVAKAIQQHWGIENKLHWTKDVILGEDNMTLKGKNMVAILVHLNNMAHNVLKNAGYKTSKDTSAKFANKVKELIKLFENRYSK